jgi:hypothetical protein
LNSNLPPNVGSKFDAGGRALPFAGNTIIWRWPVDSPTDLALRSVLDAFTLLSVAKCFATLPPKTWHVILCEGVCDARRAADRWPTGWPLDAPLGKVTRHFADVTGEFLEDLPPLHCRLDSIQRFGDRTLAATFSPNDAAHKIKLADWRRELRSRLGMARAGRDETAVHLTLAYQIGWPNAGEEAILTDFCATMSERWSGSTLHLVEPQLHVFADMTRFERFAGRL